MSEQPTVYKTFAEAQKVSSPVRDDLHPITTAGMAHKLQGGATHQIIAVATGHHETDLLLLLQAALEEIPVRSFQFENLSKYICTQLKAHEESQIDRYQSLDKATPQQTLKALAAGYEASVRHEQLRRDRIRASMCGDIKPGTASGSLPANWPPPDPP